MGVEGRALRSFWSRSPFVGLRDAARDVLRRFSTPTKGDRDRRTLRNRLSEFLRLTGHADLYAWWHTAWHLVVTSYRCRRAVGVEWS